MAKHPVSRIFPTEWVEILVLYICTYLYHTWCWYQLFAAQESSGTHLFSSYIIYITSYLYHNCCLYQSFQALRM